MSSIKEILNWKAFDELGKNMVLISTKSWPLVTRITTLKCWLVLGCLLPWGNGSSSVKEVAKHITTSNQQDGIHKALEHFGVLASEKVFVSRDYHFNKVKTFHHMMDERTQEEPLAWDLEGATHRASFKIEELVEFVRAASPSEEDFGQAVSATSSSS